MNAAFGILTALRAREKTGRGQSIDVSMLEGQLGLLDILIGHYLADGIVPARWGTAYKSVLPYQTFRTRTQDLALAIGSDKLWRSFCPLLGLEDMKDDPRYATNAARAANRETMIARLQEAFLRRTYAEWEEILVAAGIPIGAINTIDQVVDHPQVTARGILVESEHPVAGTVRLVGPRVKLSETPGAIWRPAPLLDQHTDEVLGERLGLDAKELERLRQSRRRGLLRCFRRPRGARGRAHPPRNHHLAERQLRHLRRHGSRGL
jgi:formyl-CoA transferase/CoA:oxalate CoA-transferase